MPDTIDGRRLGLGLVVSAVLLAVTGCGADQPSTTPTPALPPAVTGSSSPGSLPPQGPAPTSLASVSPSSTPSATTSTYGTDLTLSGDRLSYQPLRWYTGKAAVQRCAEKKIEPELEFCSTYYYEKTGARAQAVLGDPVTVALVGEGSSPKPSTRRALITALKDENIAFAQLSLAGDTVTAVTEVFAP